MTVHFLSFIRYWNQRETSSLEWGKHSKARVERLRDDYPLSISTLRGVRPLAHRTKEDEQVGQRLMPALVLLKLIECPERFRRRAALLEGTELTPASPRAR